MAHVSLDMAKNYLRIQHTADDTLLEALLNTASAAISSWLQRPVAIEERTFRVSTRLSYGSFQKYASTVFLPMYPMETLTSVVDADGVSLTLTDFDIDYRSGVICYGDGSEFVDGPYRITGTFGLAAYDEYESSIEPSIHQAILDIVSDLYQRRNPAATSEREGGGVEVVYSNQTRGVGADNKREDLVTPRTAALIAPWRMVGGV